MIASRSRRRVSSLIFSSFLFPLNFHFILLFISVFLHKSQTNTNMSLLDPSKRRRFQPPITTFFSRPDASLHDDFSPSVSHNHYSATTASPTPLVSAKTQSSLLGAGMRVRKAIAEGYKTKASSLEGSNPAPALQTTSHAELAPFCGFTKSGGGLAGPVRVDDGDAFSLPPSSQESVGSAALKRGRDDSDYEDLGLLDATYPGSSPSRSHDVNPLHGRPVRNPSLAHQRRLLSEQNRDMPALQNARMNVDDFEEASFLRLREEVDAECC